LLFIHTTLLFINVALTGDMFNCPWLFKASESFSTCRVVCWFVGMSVAAPFAAISSESEAGVAVEFKVASEAEAEAVLNLSP
jgi:hypothetical protein